MVSNKLSDITHLGNLESYKLYTRPTAHRLYGSTFSYTNLSKHKKNVQQLLEILALNGSLTTWEMAKIELVGDLSGIKPKKKNTDVYWLVEQIEEIVLMVFYMLV